MSRRARLSALVLLALLTACGTPPVAPPSETAATDPTPTASTVEGPVAAIVDGDPITLAEVEATVRDTGLSPREALHRLEQERALLHRAQHAALHADAEADDAVRRASVQALLRARVEDAVGDASVDDAEVAARYQANRAAWARPERRASVHVLAIPTDEHDEAAQAAARRFVASAIARMAFAPDPAAIARAIEAEGVAGRSFTIRVESIPATDRHGALEEPYLAALFAIPRAPGVAPLPVTTSFGVHAVALTSIEPPFEVSLEEASPILRRQLVSEHRARALDALTSELAAQGHVAIDERLAATVFARDLSDSPEHAR